MMHRFFVLLYVFAFAGAVVTPVAFFFSEAEWDKNTITHYKAQCANGKDVILQGSQTDEPTTYSDTTLYADYGLQSNMDYYEDMWKFYCANYDEVRAHILAYRSASSIAERGKATQAFQAFEREAQKRLPAGKNFMIVPVKEEWNKYAVWTPFWGSLLLLAVLMILLQIVRMSYVYVTIGKVVWHPFRGK